jgi:hypothetical protein
MPGSELPVIPADCQPHYACLILISSNSSGFNSFFCHLNKILKLCFHLFYPLEDQTLQHPTQQVRGHIRTRGAPQGAAAASRIRVPASVPRASPPGPRCALPRALPTVPAPGPESIFVFPFFPPRALSRKRFPIPHYWAAVGRSRGRSGGRGGGRGGPAAGGCGVRPAAAPRAPGRGGPACRTPRPGRARRYSASRAH